tara:strand:+ start:584 stop:1708 length:1125 start_codon:yes stop_codon:yes gene_type:complete
MATQFKAIGNNDVTKTKTLIHEAIPVTGTLVSGTYGKAPYAGLGSERNIKNYSHGMFQSVYDYPHLSSSANHLFDVTFGYNANSPMSGTSNRVQQEKKINIYNQMAQVLMGHDITGGIKNFTWGPNGKEMNSCFFVNFSRLLTKDEIKKGSFEMLIGTGSAAEPFGDTTTGAGGLGYTVVKRPASAAGVDSFYTDSPAGEYTLLSSSKNQTAGLLFYQAGIAVLTSSLLIAQSGNANFTPAAAGILQLTGAAWNTTVGGSEMIQAIMTGSSITASCNEFRHRLKNVKFNNTTELHSTIYYIRAHHNEFNYSGNPTYLSGSKIRVKTSTTEEPVSYITTVGMYSADNELLAVAKLSEPIKKTPNTDLTLRVRLDY